MKKREGGGGWWVRVLLVWLCRMGFWGFGSEGGGMVCVVKESVGGDFGNVGFWGGWFGRWFGGCMMETE